MILSLWPKAWISDLFHYLNIVDFDSQFLRLKGAKTPLPFRGSSIEVQFPIPSFAL